MRHYTLKNRLLCLLMAVCLLTMTACHSGTDLPEMGTAAVGESSGSTENSSAKDSTSAADSSSASTEAQTQETEASNPTLSAAEQAAAQAEQERFSSYTYDLFLESVLDNTINLHYTIANPESYGITEYPITLGSYEEWTEEDILNDLDEMAVELATYDYSLLTDEQKMTYDILLHYIETERSASSLSLYYEPLGPTTGAATQLPITFAEYSFYCEQDIKDYLELLPLLQGYFESIMAFEQKKADAGLFMTEATLDANLEICEDFLANPDNNFLITSFASRMEEIDWLDDQAKADYIAQNKTLVYDIVFPAYNYLASALESMRGYCTEAGGLTRLPEGQAYFSYLMESRLGSDRTPEEMLALIESYQQQQMQEMYNIIYTNQVVASSLNNPFSFALTEPTEILEYLKEKIKDDYPEIPETSYTIRYVEKELEDVLSPAFYMIPPLDRYLENTIYINNGSVDESTLFTTLAHEGYPGHLYQNVYFNSKNTEPLRSILSYLGYSEGWATYVENEAYAYDKKASKNLLRFYELNNTVTLSMYAALDIAINYLGWDYTQTGEYVAQFFGEQDDSVIKEIYDVIAGDPCYYLAYHGGYLEIMELRSIAETTLGNDFNLKEFHTFFLNLGECPFSLANQRLADWLELQK